MSLRKALMVTAKWTALAWLVLLAGGLIGGALGIL